MATGSEKSEKDGFDCEFVQKLPEGFQSECPICLQIIREPHQVLCCGYNFCRACIERIKTDNKPCPICKKENFTTFHDKGLQYSLYGFQVYCSHKQEGCEWKGELGQLDNHLNLSPQSDKQLKGCGYIEIECIYCSELIKRFNITAHQAQHCPKRPFSCEYCQTYKSHYKDVINNHWPVCGYHPVKCPNECDTFLQRQNLENHVTKDCPKTVIDCDFHHVGCDVKLPRKNMPAHLKANLVTHMSLQATSYSKLLASGILTSLQEKVNQLELDSIIQLASYNQLQSQVETLRTENEALKAENKTLKHQLSTLQVSTGAANLPEYTAIPLYRSIEFTMDNFKQQLRDEDIWHSPPFYTHQGGYKFCLEVIANGYGDGKGTHISVYTNLMMGEYDDYLKWPFRGNIIVQLVDQKGGKKYKHYRATISYKDGTPECIADRVSQGEENYGWGKTQFLSHNKLEPKYLKNDCLCFQVTKIELFC